MDLGQWILNVKSLVNEFEEAYLSQFKSVQIQ